MPNSTVEINVFTAWSLLAAKYQNGDPKLNALKMKSTNWLNGGTIYS